MISSSNVKKFDIFIIKFFFFIIFLMIVKGDVIFKRLIFFLKVFFVWFKYWL